MLNSTTNIFLVGLMGSGKTTIGRALAKRLNKRFVDADHEIEVRTGATIPLIFEIEGEASFRQREADVIRDLTAQQGIVLATGGGAILNKDSRELLRQHGIVIYLRASVSSILQRTSHDRNRPLLQTDDPKARIEELSRQRSPLYQEIAHIIVETGRPNVQSVVQNILGQLEPYAANASDETQPVPSNESSVDHPMKPSPEIFAELTVALDERSYPIVIGSHLLEHTEFARYVPGKRVAIVTNTTVAPLYLDRLTAMLESAGKRCIPIVLPDGEEEKNMHNLMHIFDVLLEKKCDRKTTLIALGGGVIGDMAGFAAATYMRGVPFVQVPTTLLAQVDSSVGGKTAINHPLGKNMIGAFYQPQCVLADTSTLRSLPPRELSAGLAEVIKHGAIIDKEFFHWQEANMAKLIAGDDLALAYAIQRSCEIKADVVRQDERESGLRAILNFGHTFGHAIEAGLGYGKWLHGEAVGCGMVMAADLSTRLGYLAAEDRDRIIALVRAAGLPVQAPDLGNDRWRELMEVDKKNEDGMIKFILLKPLGQATITSAPAELLEATLNVCVQAR